VLARYRHSYAEHQFWNVLLPRFVTPGTTAKVLEVGCAPGRNLVRFHSLFGYTPFGVEYAQAGVELTRRTFEEHELNPGNVIHSDFFSESFQAAYVNSFDVVLSRGFIEHFTDPDTVLQKHLNLLVPGGMLIVTIPNFRGVNYWLGWPLMRDLYRLHNLNIMDLKTFRKLMTMSDLVPVFCGYQGMFNLGLFDTGRKTGWQKVILPVMRRANVALNILLHIVFGKRALESRFTSPYLVFIGLKQQG
jgi:SAM-dependent methyltransferase